MPGTAKHSHLGVPYDLKDFGRGFAAAVGDPLSDLGSIHWKWRVSGKEYRNYLTYSPDLNGNPDPGAIRRAHETVRANIEKSLKRKT